MKIRAQLSLCFAAFVFIRLTGSLVAGVVEPASQETSSGTVVVGCEVRMIEAPRVEVNKLFSSTAYFLTDDQLHKLDELVKQKEATILAQPRLITENNVAAEVKGVRELIYPSEYGDPNALSSASTPSSEVVASNTAVYVTVQNNPADSKIADHGAGGMNIFAPKSFKTRDIGACLQITPMIQADRKTVECKLSPSFTVFAGYDKFDVSTASGKAQVQQPICYSYAVATSVVVPSGGTVLLGVFDCEHCANRDKVILMLFSAVLTTPPLPAR